jgi:hypothetical protein
MAKNIVVKKTPTDCEVMLPGSKGGDLSGSHTFTVLMAEPKQTLLLDMHPGQPAQDMVQFNDVCFIIKRGIPQTMPISIAQELMNRAVMERRLIMKADEMMERMKAGGLVEFPA